MPANLFEFRSSALRFIGGTAAAVAVMACAPAASAMSCERIAHLAFPGATVTAADAVAAGQFSPPGGKVPFDTPAMRPGGDAQPDPNPAFCRITATLRPTADSDIKVEVWLPETRWNGKFLAVGSFGWAGSIMYGGLLNGLQHGYAVASTDEGHDSASGGMGGSFVHGHPEKLIDYAYRADHLMTLYAKRVIRVRYGKAPSKSYWIGCSLGGLEGLIEAQRYPTDFDGIVAGAPPNPIARFNAAQIWASWLVSRDPSRQIPAEKFTLLHDAALRRCASPVGQQQGFIEEPDRCQFDPGELQCKDADGADCLTAPQVFLMRQMYGGPVDSVTGKSIYPGPARGSELTLGMFASAQPMSVALDMFRYVAFDNPGFTLADMDFGKTYEAAEAKIGPLMHVDTHLKPFFDHGGKLLLYIGWNDFHNPTELISYYQWLGRDGGPLAAAGSRLFTLPGMNHCMGGEGCDTFDKLGAIDAWVSQGRAPQEMISSKYDRSGKLLRTRPICAYPRVAQYKGNGDINDAASFACVAA